MPSIAAHIVDYPAVRIAFALLGVAAGCLFFLFGLDFLRVNPIAEPSSFGIGLGMLLGQIAWWARVVLPQTYFHKRPVLQMIEALLLSVGIATTVYGFAFMPKGPAAVPLLLSLLVSGAFMLFGTLSGTRSESNDLTQRKPFRGPP